MTREPIKFIPFDENGEGRIYCNGFLPHWQQAGCTYFVTFRLADSVPKNVIDQWSYEKGKWLEARGIPVTGDDNTPNRLRKLSEHDRRAFERRFSGRMLTLLDQGFGQCVLRNPMVQEIVTTALLYFDGDRVRTGDFVVMPNHVHALLTPVAPYELEEILHSVKSYTANRINEQLNRSGTLWMNETYDHIVRDAAELMRIQEYIARNPSKAKLKQAEFSHWKADYVFED